MISRRRFAGAVSALSAALILDTPKLAAAVPEAGENGQDPEDLTEFVNIAIGTGGHGHTYPGATVPFGMVQLSPDTYTKGWEWCSGYHDKDKSLMGFSHTHLSGTGIGDLLDVLLMPGTGEPKIKPGTRENPESGYRSRFSHADEVATPGYYSVLLRDYNIRAELTATERTGIHRYTFPKSEGAHFIVDLTHVSGGDPRTVQWSALKAIGNHAIAGGTAHSRLGAWSRSLLLYAVLKALSAGRSDCR